MSNGLCYNPDPEIYGRYTCTDRTWQDSFLSGHMHAGWHCEVRVLSIAARRSFFADTILTAEMKLYCGVQVEIGAVMAIVRDTLPEKLMVSS